MVVWCICIGKRVGWNEKQLEYVSLFPICVGYGLDFYPVRGAAYRDYTSVVFGELVFADCSGFYGGVSVKCPLKHDTPGLDSHWAMRDIRKQRIFNPFPTLYHCVNLGGSRDYLFHCDES